MTQLFTCFDDAIDDGVPAGWDKKWAFADGTGLPSMTVGPAASNYVIVKRRVLRLLGTHGATDPAPVPGGVVWLRPGLLADFQSLFAVCMNGNSANASSGFIYRFRCTGQAPSDRSGYYVRAMTSVSPVNTNTLAFGKTVKGVDTDITSVTPASTVVVGDTHWLRVAVSGTHVQVRIWDATTSSEPGTWDIDTNDSAVAAAGWMGFEPYWDATRAGALDINFLSVATGADVPVVPRTNAQFTAWLGTNGLERRYLAELTATGFAANGGEAKTPTGAPAYTKQVNVYLSNGGFVSQAWDQPPSQLYNAWITKIPTYKRDMGQALSGKASLGFGTLTVSNPADPANVVTPLTGVRDRWLRMRWRRNYVKVFMGDPTWPKHDFRCIVVGRLQRPVVGSSVNEIDFPINDLSDALVNDINQLVFAAGDYAGQRQPALYGSDATAGSVQVEPPLIDSANYVYQISRRTLGAWGLNLAGGQFVHAYDNQNPLWITMATTDGTNNGTTLTRTAHGMVDGWLYVPYGAPVTGLTANFAYFVRNTTANTFQLSLTRTGAVLTGLTGGTLDNAYCFGYYIDTNGDGLLDQSVAVTPPLAEKPSLLQLVSKPAGRVTLSGLQSGYVGTQENTLRYMAIDAGIPAGLVNTPVAVNNPRPCMYHVGPTKTKAADAINTVAMGLFMYYGFSPDGFFEYDLIGFTGTSQMSLLASDVKAGSMKLLSVKQPTDFTKAQISQPWFLTGGAFQTGTQAALQGKQAVSTATLLALLGDPDGTQPMDNYPQVAEQDQTFIADTFYTDLRFIPTSLLPLLKYPVGVYSFATRMTAINLRIGQIITINLPREEWVVWTGHGSSPDRNATVDSTTAVVIGIDFNPSATDPYAVTLTVAKQLVGYWPTVDVMDGDLVQTLMLEEDGVTPILQEDGNNIIEENLIV